MRKSKYHRHLNSHSVWESDNGSQLELRYNPKKESSLRCLLVTVSEKGNSFIVELQKSNGSNEYKITGDKKISMDRVDEWMEWYGENVFIVWSDTNTQEPVIDSPRTWKNSLRRSLSRSSSFTKNSKNSKNSPKHSRSNSFTKLLAKTQLKRQSDKK